jgi:hypothetical protein
MRYVSTAAAAAAFLWLVAPAGAQTYYPTPPGAAYYSGLWPEMVDNGCCTDFPTHTPSDFVADQLNRQVLDYNAGRRVTPP